MRETGGTDHGSSVQTSHGTREGLAYVYTPISAALEEGLGCG